MYSSRLLLLLLIGLLTLAACSDAEQKKCGKPSKSGKQGCFGKIGNFFKSCFGSKHKNQCKKVPVLGGCKGNACTKAPCKDKPENLWKSKDSWTSVHDFLKDFGKTDIGESTKRLKVSSEGLTVEYSAKETGSRGGVTFYAHPLTKHHYDHVPAMTLTYEVKFPEGFDFSGEGMLPGLWGNTEGVTGNVAKDEKDCGNGKHGDCWSARLMWKKGRGAAYMYAPKAAGKQKYCNDNWNCCGKKWGDVIGRNFEFKTNHWNKLALTVGTNGVLQVFLDSKLVISYDNIKFGEARRFVGIKWETFFVKRKGTKSQKAHFRNFALHGQKVKK